MARAKPSIWSGENPNPIPVCDFVTTIHPGRREFLLSSAAWLIVVSKKVTAGSGGARGDDRRDPQSAADPSRSLLRRPGRLWGGATKDLLARLVLRRVRVRPFDTRRVPDLRRRWREPDPRARRRQAGQGLLQRVPPPRVSDLHRSGRTSFADISVSLSRLELRAGRAACRRPEHGDDA